MTWGTRCAAGIQPQGQRSAPSAKEAAWAAAETKRILCSLPLPTASPDAKQWAKALARMRQPLLTHLSRSRRGLPPDGHLHWAADLEQLLHALLSIGWSPSTLASFVAKGRDALTQTAAGVQQRLDFLQREGGLTTEEAARSFGFGFGFTLGYTPISALQRGMEQLQAAGLGAEGVRRVLRRCCQVLTTSPQAFERRLNCLRGAQFCCSAQHSMRCIFACLIPRSATICCSCCIAYLADQVQHCIDLGSPLSRRSKLQRRRSPCTDNKISRHCLPLHRELRGEAQGVGQAAGPPSRAGPGNGGEAP